MTKLIYFFITCNVFLQHLDRIRKEHKGIDIKANNYYVYSVMPEKVIKKGNDRILGNYINYVVKVK